jgi:methylated-DNA-[protein]-cysteine S-methyltransferase
LYFTFETNLGTAGLTASPEGIVALCLPPQLVSKASNPPTQFTSLVKRLQAYFEGVKISFPDKLDLSNSTPFQTKVWEAARLIPHGETRSYRWVAEQIGKPGATRAVGQALGKNPLPIIIPCHRVIASDGSLGGYSGGREMKRHLLQLELTSASTKPGL